MNKYSKFMTDIAAISVAENSTINSVLKKTFTSHNLLRCYIDMLMYELNNSYRNADDESDSIELKDLFYAFKAYEAGTACDEKSNYRRWCSSIVASYNSSEEGYLSSIAPSNFEGTGFFSVYYDDSGVLHNTSNLVVPTVLAPTIYIDKYTPISLYMYMLEELYNMLVDNDNVISSRIIIDKYVILKMFLDGKYPIEDRVAITIYTNTSNMSDFNMDYKECAKREVKIENNNYTFECSEK